MIRKLVSSVVALSLALDPIGAGATTYYFRNVTSAPVGTVAPGATPDNGTGAPPPVSSNSEPTRGSGDLGIYLPVQIRARVGVDFSLQVSADNATGKVVWQSVGAALPPGLTFNAAAGLISGVPTAVGSVKGIAVSGTDGDRTGTSPGLTIDVRPPPAIAVASDSKAETGARFALQPTGTEIYGSRAWSLTGGLPLGLGFDPATGAISGTPRQQGTFAGLRLSVTDSDGARGVSQAFSITVTSKIAISNLQSANGARTGRPMTAIRPRASGTAGPYAWSISADGKALPVGLALDAKTGAITGTPTAKGRYDGIVLQVADTPSGATTLSAPFAVTVADAPGVVVGGSYAFRRAPYAGMSIRPTASNLLGEGYWSVTGNPGYNFSTTAGVLDGYLGNPGTFPGIAFSVIDLFDGAKATTQPTKLTVYPELAVGGLGIPAARVGTPFTMQAPIASGLVGAPAWSISGTLPKGLSVDPATGIVSGTPIEEGLSYARINLVDGIDGTKVGIDFSLNVLAPDAVLPFQVTDIPATLPATAGKPFNLAPNATGAKGSVTWFLAGTLPSWASFYADTGRIAGTPDAAGATGSLVLTAIDAANNKASSGAFSIAATPADPFSVTVPETVTATFGEESVTTRPLAANYAPPAAFSLFSGRAPEGMTLNLGTGSFEGTPTVSGTVSGLVLAATDQTGATTYSNPFAVSVVPTAKSPVATMASATAATGQALSVAPTVVNAYAPLTWSLESGRLPAWASLDPATGAISGTPPAAGTSGDLVLKVADAFQRGARTAPFTLSVVDTPAFAIALADDNPALVGSSFTLTPRVTGQNGTVRFALSSGSLPDGLALDAATGVLSGVPSRIGRTAGLVLTATDSGNATVSSQPFAISVTASPLVLAAYPTPLNAYVGVPLSAPAPALTGASGTVAWSLSAGTLPAWARLDAATGLISGTPDALATTRGLRLKVTDANGTSAQTNPFSIAAIRPTLAATGPDGRVRAHAGAPIAIAVPSAAGVVGSVSWKLASGTLPVGLALDEATGAIGGTAAVASADNLVLRVRDSYDGASADTAPFGIDVLGDPAITVAGRYPGASGIEVKVVPGVTNVIGTQIWSLAGGTLPAWAGLDPATGAITGTPPEPGTTDGLTLAVVDAAGGRATSTPFSIAVGTGLYATLAKGAYTPRIGVPFASDAPQVYRNTGAVTWSLGGGTLPGWATIDRATGVISGTPDAVSSGTLRLRLSDGANGDALTQDFAFTVTDIPAVSAASQTLRVGAPLTLSPTVAGANGGQAWGVASGALPAWATLDASRGTITGTPNAIGTATLSLRVKDEDGAVGTSAPFTIAATEGLSASNVAASYGGRVNQPFAMARIVVGNAKGALSWGLAEGSRPLPVGLGVSADTGVLAGTPTNSGAFGPTLLVTDASDGAALAVPLSLSLASTLRITGTGTTTVHVGQVFSTPAPAVTGQRGTLDWSLAGGTLPGWADLSRVTGIVSGTAPAIPGTTGTLQIAATDSTDQVTSAPAALTVQVVNALGVANLPTAFTARFGGTFASVQPSAVNAIGAVRWDWGPGATPPSWARLDPGTGIITGQPDALASTPNLRLVATDATKATASSAPFTLSVYSQPAVAVPSVSAQYRVGDVVSFQPRATGVAGSQAWSLVAQSGSDALPAGLSLDEATGLLSGSPTAPGIASFVLRVVDGLDGTAADSQLVSLSVAPALSVAGMGQAYYGRVGSFMGLDLPEAVGGSPNLSWSLGLPGYGLPRGLSMPDRSTGLVKGVPVEGLGTTTATLTVQDALDGRSASTSFLIGVQNPPDVRGVANVTVRNGADIASAGFAPAAGGIFYPGAARWALNGALPDGVSLVATTGKLVGSPAGYAAARTFANNTLTVTDTTDNASATSPAFSVTVNPTLSVVPAATAVTVRAGQTLALGAPAVSGLVGTPAWGATTLAGPSVPVTFPGGIPTLAPSAQAGGASTLALALTDGADGAKATSDPIAVTVVPATTLAYAANTPVTPGQAISLQPTVANTQGALAYELASGGPLPTGIALDPATGVISGSAATNQTLLLTVRARDVDGYVATSNTVRIAISNAPDVYLGAVPAAKVGRPYALAPVSNAASQSWTLAGTLPASLTMNAATGAVTGTPTVAGTSGNLTLTVRDGVKAVNGSSSPFTIAVAPGNVISVDAAPAKWRVGLLSTARLAIANAVGAVSWAVSSGRLPAGVSLNPSTGAISGTPTEYGSFAPVIAATDSEGTVASLNYAMSVATGPSLSYAGATIQPSNPVQINPNAQGLLGAPTYRVVSGTLPDGLSLNAAGAVVGSAAAVTASPATVAVELADSDGALARATLSVMVTNTAFYVDSGGTAFEATVGQPFSLQPKAFVQAQALQQYVAWNLVGQLPTGLGFSPTTGLISGTPSAKDVGTATLSFNATYNQQTASTPSFTVRVSDRAAPSAAVPGTAYTLARGVPFSLQATSRDTVGSVKWAVTPGSGTLPVGLALNDATGLVSGKPTANGSYAFSLTLTDSSKSATTQAVAVTVQDGMTVSVTPVTSNDRVGQAYLANLQAAGASGAVTWSLVPEGSLPTGIVLDGNAATLSGIPSVGGTWPVTVQAVDALGAVATGKTTITLAARPSIGAIPSLSGLVNKAMTTFAPVPSNTQGAVAWSAVGTFPAGVTVDPATGAIAGTPTQAGNYPNLQVSLTDNGGNGLTALSAPFAITVAPASASLTATMVPGISVVQGQAMSVAPVVSGATAATQTYRLQSLSWNYGPCGNSQWWCWNDAAALPAGLGFNTSTGVISGTPTTYYPAAPSSPGQPPATMAPAYAYRIVVTDNRSPAVSVTSNQFTISVAAWTPITAAMAPSYALARGQPFTATASVGGAQGPVSYKLQSFSWNYGACGNSHWWCWNDSAALPAGLGFDASTGTVSGTPTTVYPTAPSTPNPPPAGMAPAYAYRILASETRASQTVSAYTNEFTLAVSDWTQPSVTLPQSQALVRGQPASIAPTLAGATGTVSYKLQSLSWNYGPCGNNHYWCWNDAAALPAGMSFDTGTGVISGTPTTYYPTAPSSPGQPPATMVPAMAYRVVVTETRKAGGTNQTLTATSNQLTLPVADWIQPSIAVDPTPALVRGIAASVSPTVSGASGSLSYKLQSFSWNYYACGNNHYWCWNDAAALPAGLSFSTATGVISGTPTTYYPTAPSSPGQPPATMVPAYGYRVIATETRSAGSTSQTNVATSNVITLSVADWAQPVATLPGRYDYVVGKPVTIGTAVSGATGSLSYKLQSVSYNYYACGNSPWWCWNDNQSLPAGLSFDAATGRISGTPTTAYTTTASNGAPGATTWPAMAYRVVVTETRAAAATSQTNTTTSNQMVIGGTASAPGLALTYGTANLASGQVNVPASFAPALTGAASATGNYTLTYVQSTATNVTKDYNTSSLPPGLAFAAATGVISGTPAPGAVGLWHGYKVCAPTAAGTACAPEVVFSIADRPAVTVDVPGFPQGVVQQSITPILPTVQNAVGSVSYTLVTSMTANIVSPGETVQSTLPAGLKLDAATGAITGVPTTAGVYRGYGITATDSQGATYKGTSREIVIRVDPQPAFSLAAPAVVDIQPNVALSPALAPVPAGAYGKVTWASAVKTGQTSSAAGPDGPYPTVVGALPAGLSYDAAAGRISGTPSGTLAPGYYRGYQVCATDELARTACTDEIVLRNVPKPAFAVTVQPYVSVRQGGAVRLQAQASNAVGAVTWAASLATSRTTSVASAGTGPNEYIQAALPTGLTYDKATGTISGTVANAAAVGRYRGYAVQANDTQSAATFSNEIVIEVVAADPLTIVMPQIVDVTRGTAFTLRPQVSGALGTMTFAAAVTYGGTTAQDNTNGDFVKGTLPPNVAYSATDGSVSGTAATAAVGRWRGYKVCASDSRGTVCSGEFALNVQ